MDTQQSIVQQGVMLLSMFSNPTVGWLIDFWSYGWILVAKGLDGSRWHLAFRYVLDEVQVPKNCDSVSLFLLFCFLVSRVETILSKSKLYGRRFVEYENCGVAPLNMTYIEILPRWSLWGNRWMWPLGDEKSLIYVQMFWHRIVAYKASRGKND